MAKKKATMTLKDFHGGSIPSDLPLPSAPGLIVRQPDRTSFDRPSTWGNPIGRSDHRLRPGSAGAARNIEDRTLFFPNTSHIGRNFDEDERKPLDGGSLPRRIVSDENIFALPGGAEINMDNLAVNRTASRPSLTPTSEYSSRGVRSLYSGRFTEGTNVGVGTHSYGGTSGLAAGGSRPNAWGLRKDSAVKEAVPPNLSASDAASKMAYASALDKVSSGRWHPKQQLMSQVDVEFFSHPAPEKRCDYSGPVMYTKDAYNIDVGNEFHDTSPATHVGESFTIDGKTRGSEKIFSAYGSGTSTASVEPEARNHLINAHGASTVENNDTQLPVPSQTAERPKLKLLPRSKPLEKMEPSVEHKVCNQSEPAHMKNECFSPSSTKNGHTGFYVSDQGLERPKMNLGTRLQPIGDVDGTNGSDRKLSFGGARPRDLTVLKAHGVDDTVTHNIDMGQPPNWAKPELSKSDRVSHHLTVPRYVNKEGNFGVDSRAASSAKRDHRTGVERTDLQHKNWRNENRRNYRITEERQQQLASQERPPSPESWRKPVEQPDTSGPHYGKGASPLELAQAFSKSKSDMAIPDRLSGHRSFTNRSQVPFSRLTVSSPRPQINGH